MRKEFTTFLVAMICFCSFQIQAQSDKCAFDRILKTKTADPVFQQNRAEFEAFVQQFANQANNRSGSGSVTIPCVVHIVHTGQAAGIQATNMNGDVIGANPNDAQINSAIADMNDAFGHKGVYDAAGKNGFYDAATNVEFVLAKRKPDGSATTGIERYDVNALNMSWASTFEAGGMDAGEGGGVLQATIIDDLGFWPPADYMNIWIVHEIENNTETLGFASFPNANPGKTDGLTMLASAFGYDPDNSEGYLLDPGTNGNGTSNHEVGHYLNLFHTFEGDNDDPSTCPSNTGNGCGNDVGDCCGDVAAHKRTSGCPTYSTTGNSCTGGSNAYIHNFMDYSDDVCFHGFSNDQKTRMEAALASPRQAFCTSIADDAPTGTFPPALAASVPNPDALFGIKSVTLGGNTFHSLAAFQDGGYLNRVASQPTVDLNTASSYSITVDVNTGNAQDVKVYIDYDNNGVYSASELVATSAASGTSHSLGFTTPAAGGSLVTDQRLRMRVISAFEAADITSTSTVDGQIEDYSVKLTAVLPVEMAFFNARLTNNHTAELVWQTASESNNKGFEVERSSNGSVFETIGFVRGNGDSNEVNAYNFTDADLAAGTYFYRLKQIDFDGNFEYSDAKSVTVKAKQAIRAFPNPANDFLYVEFEKDNAPNLILFNALGQQVQVAMSQNNNQMTLHLADLKTGIYFLHDAEGGFITRFVKK